MPCNRFPIGSCQCQPQCMPCHLRGFPGPAGPTGPTGPAGPAGPTGVSEYLIPFANGDDFRLASGDGVTTYSITAIGFGNRNDEAAIGAEIDGTLPPYGNENMAFTLPQDAQIMSLYASFVNTEPLTGGGDVWIRAEIYVAYQPGDMFEPFFGVTLSPSYNRMNADTPDTFSEGFAEGPSAVLPKGALVVMGVYLFGYGNSALDGHLSAGMLMRSAE